MRRERGRIDGALVAMGRGVGGGVGRCWRARREGGFVNEAARLGCRIYVHTILARNQPQPVSLLLELTREVVTLITTAQQLGIIDFGREGGVPEVWVWLLTLGGVLPLGEKELEWFARRLVEVWGTWGGEWEGFARGEGRGMCWGIGLGTSPVRELWRRVEGLWDERVEEMEVEVEVEGGG